MVEDRVRVSMALFLDWAATSYVAVVLDNRGMRQKSLDYWEELVKGAKKAKGTSAVSCLPNRSRTTSFNYLMHAL